MMKQMLTGIVCLLAGLALLNGTYAFAASTSKNLDITVTHAGSPPPPPTIAVKSLQTTGSISSGSKQLTVATNPGFAVGDWVIVAVGGESGAGLRGTVGVGGVWPSKNYATVSAMNADSSQPANTFAWVTTDATNGNGSVYQWNGSWVANASNSQSYYFDKAIPKAMVTTISAIGGNVLTLADAAKATATNASVYYDNAPGINAAFQANQTAGFTFQFPAGRFAVGDELQLITGTSQTVAGAGSSQTTLFSPAGAPSAMFDIGGVSSPTVRDIGLTGNLGNDRFGLAWGPNNNNIGETFIDQGSAFPSGFLIEGSDSGTARNLLITNVFQNAVAARSSNNLQVSNVHVDATAPIRQYVQWFFEFADSSGGSCTDCTITSVNLVPGWEVFRSTGVTYTWAAGTTSGQNATMSANCANNFTFQNPKLTFTAGAQFDEDSFSKFNPIVNVNTNICPSGPYPSSGGVINALSMTQQGFIDGTQDLLAGVVVNANNPNITIGADGSASSYTAPNAGAGFCPVATAQTDGALNFHVNRMTANGTPCGGVADFQFTPGTGGQCNNCVGTVSGLP